MAINIVLKYGRVAPGLYLALVVLGICLVGLSACGPAGGVASLGLRQGEMAPDFVLEDINGRSVALSSLRGQPVVLNFWSISCPPCRYEMPEIQAVHQKFRDQVVFIGISPADTPADVRQFVTVRGYSWIFVTDPSGVVSLSYGVRYFPTTYFLDAGGRVSSVIVGGPLRRDVLEMELVRAGVKAG